MKTKNLWVTFILMYVVWVMALLFKVPFIPWGPIWIGCQSGILLAILVIELSKK